MNMNSNEARLLQLIRQTRSMVDAVSRRIMERIQLLPPDKANKHMSDVIAATNATDPAVTSGTEGIDDLATSKASMGPAGANPSTNSNSRPRPTVAKVADTAKATSVPRADTDVRATANAAQAVGGASDEPKRHDTTSEGSANVAAVVNVPNNPGVPGISDDLGVSVMAVDVEDGGIGPASGVGAAAVADVRGSSERVACQDTVATLTTSTRERTTSTPKRRKKKTKVSHSGKSENLHNYPFKCHRCSKRTKTDAALKSHRNCCPEMPKPVIDCMKACRAVAGPVQKSKVALEMLNKRYPECMVQIPTAYQHASDLGTETLYQVTGRDDGIREFMSCIRGQLLATMGNEIRSAWVAYSIEACDVLLLGVSSQGHVIYVMALRRQKAPNADTFKVSVETYNQHYPYKNEVEEQLAASSEDTASMEAAEVVSCIHGRQRVPQPEEALWHMDMLWRDRKYSSKLINKRAIAYAMYEHVKLGNVLTIRAVDPGLAAKVYAPLGFVCYALHECGPITTTTNPQEFEHHLDMAVGADVYDAIARAQELGVQHVNRLDLCVGVQHTRRWIEERTTQIIPRSQESRYSEDAAVAVDPASKEYRDKQLSAAAHWSRGTKYPAELV